MRYLDVDGLGPVSRIGLGTWQFGSREWGYGDEYADRAARATSSGGPVELGVTLFDTAEIYGFGRSERILGEALGDDRGRGRRRQQDLPGRAVPAGGPAARGRGSAQRLRLQRIPLYQVHQPNPVVPDSVIMPGMRDAARRGPDRRGRRLQLLAGPLAGGRRRARPAGRQQPGAVLAGARRPAGRPRALRRAREPGGHRLQPAGPGPARRPVRRRPPPGRGPRGQPAVRHREPAPGRAAARRPARGGRRARRQAGADRARLAARPAAGRRHPGRLERRAAGVQRRGGRARPRPRTSRRR